MELPSHVYIDGQKHQVVAGSEDGVYVDHPEMPGSRCAFHRINPAHLRAGTAVITAGHRYSLSPERTKE